MPDQLLLLPAPPQDQVYTPGAVIVEGVYQLPVFNGWTVDTRVKEFRQVIFDENGDEAGIKFLSFYEPEGDQLLSDYLSHLAQSGNDEQYTELLVTIAAMM